MLAALFVSALALAPYLPWLLPNLADRPEYLFNLAEIEVNSPPHDWIPPTLAEDVLQDSTLPRKVSLLKPNLCRDVALAWGRSPWIREVKNVRVTNRPGLQIAVEYRVPAAFIETPRGLYPVDREGVLLPPRDFAIADADRLPHVRNIASAPRAVGRSWGERVVPYAARLAEVLAPGREMETFWRRYQLQAIVAPSVPEGAEEVATLVFELETSSGNRIVWGQPPGLDGLEQTPDQKLARLEYLSQTGALESPGGPYRIDIRPFEDITFESLGGARYR